MFEETDIDTKFWSNFCITSPNAKKLVAPLVIFTRNGQGRELCFQKDSLSLFISLDLSEKTLSIPATLLFYDAFRLITNESGDWFKPQCRRDLNDLWFQYFVDCTS